LRDVCGRAINVDLSHSIASASPPEEEAQASYACAISSFKRYLEAIRPYEAVGAQGKVIGISEGYVEGIAAVVFAAGATFDVAVLRAG
jgi:hypothetical protein